MKLKMRTVKQIGKQNIVFEVEGKDFFDCQMQIQKLSFSSIKKCGVCEGEHLHLYAYKAKDEKGNFAYEYIKICCSNPDCKASLTFGQKKADPETYYPRRNEDRSLKWEQYNKDGGSEKTNNTSPEEF